MREQTIATRYARALLQAIKPESFQQVEQDLVVLKEMFADEKIELSRIMANPAFQVEERQKVMAKLGEAFNWKPELMRLVDLLVLRGRIAHMGLIADAYVAALDDKLGRARAVITSSHQMSEPEKAKLLQALQGRIGRFVVAEIHVDERMLGGVKANVGGLLFDGTVAAKLANLGKVLAQASV